MQLCRWQYSCDINLARIKKNYILHEKKIYFGLGKIH